jgi:hypothetical protein
MPSGERGAPKERPIILSAPMIRAILANRKQQTRRLATSPLAKCLPGDLLWVREVWQVPALCNAQYRATATERIGHWNPAIGPWRPSIHMPRWASRITLEVTGVKFERLQDITIADALAEGALEATDIPYVGAMTGDQARVAFSLLWDRLHGPRSWEENPTIVCISFKRVRECRSAASEAAQANRLLTALAELLACCELADDPNPGCPVERSDAARAEARAAITAVIGLADPKDKP